MAGQRISAKVQILRFQPADLTAGRKVDGPLVSAE